jgi:hypothetical protein
MVPVSCNRFLYNCKYHHSPVGIPEGLLKGLPKYQDLPAILLGRLAVDQKAQKKRIGELLSLVVRSSGAPLGRGVLHSPFRCNIPSFQEIIKS